MASSADDSKLTLYGCLICPYVQRARMALEYLKVPYEYEEVDLFTSQQFSEWYTALNPCQKVPTIKHNGKLIFESLVIMEYLDEAFGKQTDVSLFPADFDAAKRAHVRQWVRVFDDRVAASSFKLYQLIKEKNDAGIQEAVKQVQSGLKYLAKHSGLTERFAAAAAASEGQSQQQQYFWGDKLTFGDIAQLPNLNGVYQLLQKAAKLDLFVPLEDTDKEHLEAFGKWFHYALQSDAFQRAAYRVSTLPPAEKSAIVAEKAWKAPEDFNFEQYWRTFMEKRFNIQFVA